MVCPKSEHLWYLPTFMVSPNLKTTGLTLGTTVNFSIGEIKMHYIRHSPASKILAEVLSNHHEVTILQ